jgi:hypothetical protein
MTPSRDNPAESRLLYFSPVFWQSYPQRPHAFVQYFLSRTGGRALWVNPYVSRLPMWSDLRQSYALHDQQTERLPGLEVLNVFALPIEPLPGGAALNDLLFWRSIRKACRRFAKSGRLLMGIGKPSMLAVRALEDLKPALSFYDVMDHFAAFHGGLSRRTLLQAEEEIIARVDELYVSSSFLEQIMSSRHGKIRKVFNAYDMDYLAGDTRPARSPLRFGYLGSVASWFDWESVRDLALAFPDAQIDLVGPVFEAPPASLPGNVKLLGARTQRETTDFLKEFSLGLIPFKKSALTDGVDPIKYYAYRAQGLAVLSTPFGEMTRRDEKDGVFFLEPGADLHRVVEEALAWQGGDVAAFRAENSWERRLKEADVFEMTCKV